MRVASISIREGFFYTKKNFSDGFNLIYSEKNSAGKTTLLRCILYALGYKIPGTKGFNIDSINTSIVLYNDDEEKIVINRNDINEIELIINEKQTTYCLPHEHTKLLSVLFHNNNEEILSNLLGALYIDQEKGWTLLNRGKVIGVIPFNIDSLIRGLSNVECNDLLLKERTLDDNLKKYKQMLDIANYMDTINDADTSLISSTYNEERFIKFSQLTIEKDNLKKEIKRIDNNMNLNKKTIELIESLKLVIRISPDETKCITRDDVVALDDSVDLLNAKKKMLSSELNSILSELDKYSMEIKKEDNQLSLFEIEDVAKKFDKNILSLPIKSTEVKKAVDYLNKEKNEVTEQILEMSRTANPITLSLFDNIKKYMKELGVPKAENMSWNYIFTNNLKELTGALLHKTVFSFKMAYILEIQKCLNIKLPIIIDSPRGNEIDESNVNKMIEILSRDFSENQIIVASIFHYKNDENVIELKDKLLDSILEE